MGRAPYPARVGGDSMTVLAGLGELQQYSGELISADNPINDHVTVECENPTEDDDVECLCPVTTYHPAEAVGSPSGRRLVENNHVCVVRHCHDGDVDCKFPSELNDDTCEEFNADRTSCVKARCSHVHRHRRRCT